MGGQVCTLLGEAGEQPGLWWREGRLIDAAHGQIEVLQKIKNDERGGLERLELTYSNTEAPWLAVDFLALRSGLEQQARSYLGSLETWCAPSTDLKPVAPRVARIGRADASRIFYTLITVPLTCTA
jgi:hypothetical protein